MSPPVDTAVLGRVDTDITFGCGTHLKEQLTTTPVLDLPQSRLSVSQSLELQLRKNAVGEDGFGEGVYNNDAFYVADLGEVWRQHWRWKELLPRIEPFYAVKCNPDPKVVKLLADLGIGFDCASKNEIKQVLDLGVDPSRIIYANPCKQSSFVRYATNNDVRMMTFDNTEELHKIKKLFPEAHLVLRILTDDSKSLCQLGLKFGAPLDSCRHLLETAQALDLNVIGVSFHVGSGCYDEHAFEDAVLRARHVFDLGLELGFDFRFLDVGGGFPGADVQEGITFSKVAAILGPAVDRHFPDPAIRVIAEPGRYYAASAFTLATSIIARRTVLRDHSAVAKDQHDCQGSVGDNEVINDSSPSMDDHPAYMYYINDGMYGSFNCIMFDHQQPVPKILQKGGKYIYSPYNPPYTSHDNTQVFDTSIWGPTCDSIDCVVKKCEMDQLDVGDWLVWENMGAYTAAAGSAFNGFERVSVFYTFTA
ncbi:hypothetical protein BZG36_03159 [Bifiguratus adelaidae]|uniref:ornithine decarboxylase n=1 Tax=Bifiguratus adelaidae TaxID=1938954 RepID=A0A261Y133_9FUNG|nr:hypothetical protein BZG36_03159 [Bifiguratus adelaidae]